MLNAALFPCTHQRLLDGLGGGAGRPLAFLGVLHLLSDVGQKLLQLLQLSLLLARVTRALRRGDGVLQHGFATNKTTQNRSVVSLISITRNPAIYA